MREGGVFPGMNIDLSELLRLQPMLVMFLTLGLGYLIGNLEFRKFKLGATAGVLLIGMAFGHWGCATHPELQQIGFILFIYSVGFQAGPRFFAVFASDGKRYFVLAAFVAGLAIVLAHVFQVSLNLPSGSAAGMLAGALTSTPTLAAAQGSIASGAVVLSQGETMASLENNLMVSYALTYLYGLAGLLMLVRLLPVLLRIDLPAEARKMEQSVRRPTDGESDEEDAAAIVTRAYEVTSSELVGRSLKTLDFRKQTGCLIERVKRAGALIEPGPDTVLQVGDRVSVVGDAAHATVLAEKIGPEVRDRELLTFQLTSCQVVVTRPGVIGRPLSELKLAQRGGCFLTRITRAHVPLPVNPGVILERGDIIQFFMANVGLSAGKGVAAAFLAIGPTLILCGVVLTTLPVVLGFLFGRYVLKLNAAVLLGALTGAMTSTAALSVVSDATKSSTPALGYAGSYTFANVFLTMAGTILIRWG